ncbi:MAG TPA: TetR/AcrR family transcriptional regulator [Spirochaetota bacterium]|nr:TetR/AcrR family transcriptional regulator [Spirochaetota bacterium]HOT19194.1 TetR/AcrR family transcriptional regulator [Spirochaetota bacterium]HPD04140.1 TetR/AcrR family transcriptional regulator [Spirochaetota bacterium]HPK43797.1 TetR/AcrR family transcriptional regulator [Spirochaetota bacterium]HQG41666.1 TetR/AcrR family transcriptional regulator [Spirochaetota bacterium]
MRVKQERNSIYDTRRLQLTAAAYNVVSKKGYYNFTIKDIADEAGMSAGLVHYYFKNKQDLLLNLLRQINTNIRLALQNDLANIEDPVDKLSVFILRACNLIIEEKNYFYVLLDFWTQLNHNERMRKAIQKLYQSYRKVCSDILNEGIIKGKIKQIDVIYTATMIVSMVQGLIIQYVIEPEAFDYSYYVNKIKNQIIETIISKGVNNGI